MLKHFLIGTELNRTFFFYFINNNQMDGSCALIKFEVIWIENTKFDPTKNTSSNDRKSRSQKKSINYSKDNG